MNLGTTYYYKQTTGVFKRKDHRYISFGQTGEVVFENTYVYFIPHGGPVKERVKGINKFMIDKEDVNYGYPKYTRPA